MSDRPTPETDAARHDMTDYGPPVPCSWGDWVPADITARLERERDEAREDAAKWESSSDAMERAGAEQARRADENREWALKAERERDEAREENKKFREALEWIAERYDDFKPLHSVAMDAYEMSCIAKSALRKEES